MLFIRQKKIKQTVKRALLFLGALYFLVGAFLFFFQEKILFLPSVLPQDYKYEFAHNFEELFLNTDEKAVVNALHFKVENPKGVVLYFHGNAGDLSRWGKTTEYFADKDYDVLVMDYRTFGKSTGKISEPALYSDAQFCYDYLKDRYSEDKITVYGRSIGTGIATYVAANNKPKQLILETPYYNMADVAHSRFPIFPARYFLKYKFPANEFIQDVTCPIYMFHGTDDAVIQYDSANKLFEVAPQKQTKFTVIENGHHNDLIKFEIFRNQMQSILP